MAKAATPTTVTIKHLAASLAHTALEVFLCGHASLPLRVVRGPMHPAKREDSDLNDTSSRRALPFALGAVRHGRTDESYA